MRVPFSVDNEVTIIINDNQMSKIEINGDNNHVYHKVKKSRINSDNNTTKTSSTLKWVGLASLIVAIIGLALKFIVGWDAIIKFFN